MTNHTIAILHLTALLVLTSLGCDQNISTSKTSNPTIISANSFSTETHSITTASAVTQSLTGDITAIYTEITPLQDQGLHPGQINLGPATLTFTKNNNQHQIQLSANSNKDQTINLDFPWQLGVRYKFHIQATYKNGVTQIKVHAGHANNNLWQLVGTLKIKDHRPLRQPVGFVQAIPNTHNLASESLVGSTAAAFGQTWIKTHQYNWQPVHVIEFQTTSPSQTRGWLYEKNMVAIATWFGIIPNKNGMGVGGGLPNNFRFEFDRSADTFPQMPK